MALTTDLVFNAPLGTDGNDIINSLAGATSGVSFVTDTGFTAADFAAASAGISYGIDSAQGPAVLGTSPFTLTAWVKPATPVNPGAIIIGTTISGSSSPQYSGYQLRLNGTNLEFMIGGGGANEIPVSSSITFSAWHHVAVTRSGTAIVLYIDGAVVDTGTAGSVYDTSSSYSGHFLTSGMTTNGSLYFYGYNGLISDTAMWKRALSGAEITSIYNAGTAKLLSLLPINTNLVNFYDLATGADSIGGYTLTAANGAAFSGVANLPNFNSSIYAASDIPLGGGDFSISFWFKDLKDISLAASNFLMFAGYSTGGSAGAASGISNYPIVIYTNEEIGAYDTAFRSTGVQVTQASTGSSWHLLNAVFDAAAGTMTIYLDGSQVGSAVSYSPPPSIQMFGSYTNFNYNAAENWDDIAVWQRKITPTEIGQIYAAGQGNFAASFVPLSTTLSYIFPLATNGTDLDGSISFIAANGLTHTGGSTEFPNQNSAYYLNSPYLTLKTAQPDSYTHSFWFKDLKNRSSASFGFLMALAYNKQAGGIGGYGSWDYETNYDVVIYTNDYLGTYGHANTSVGVSTLNSTGYQMTQALYNGTGWHHMACVYGVGKMTFYINGVQVGVPVSTTGMFKLQNIGSFTDKDWAAFEFMEELAIWQRSLSPSEIASIHSAGRGNLISLTALDLQGQFSTVVHSEVAENLRLEGQWSTVVHNEVAENLRLEGQFATVVHSVPTPNAIVPDITGNPGVPATFDGSASTTVSYYHWSWVSVPGGSSVANAAIPFPDNRATTPLDMTDNQGLWHFEGNPSDTSGNSRNGTVTGASLVAGKVGSQAYQFGVADKISFGAASAFISADFTISFWLKGDAAWTPAVYDSIVGASNAFTWNQGFGAFWQNATTIRFFVGSYNGNYVDLTVTPANWNHIVFTWNGSTITGYLNGSAVDTDAHSAALTGLGEDFYASWLGTHGGGEQTIDELAIWSRSISASEVAGIYAAQNGTLAGLGSDTFTFTPDIVGTYTIKLAIDGSTNTNADCVVTVPSSGGGGSPSQGATAQGGRLQGSDADLQGFNK